jgi:hypothetical protein
MKRKKLLPMQRALRQTVNWFLYSGRPWPFGNSKRHLTVRAVLEDRRSPDAIVGSTKSPQARNKRGHFVR